MVILTACMVIFHLTAGQVTAQGMAFKQAVAEAASDDRDHAAYYRTNSYASLWTGTTERGHAPRRKALFAAIAGAGAHGFPSERYDADGLLTTLKSVRSPRDLGFAEVEMSKTFLRLADDLQTGIADKASVVSGNKREVPERDRTVVSDAISKPPIRVLICAILPPNTTEYARLMKEKARLDRLIAQGGWGPTVPAKSLKPGETGSAVLALRDRMVSMGYLTRSASGSYDAALQKAVQSFQRDHGLEDDGVAGAGTVAEINTAPDARLKSVLVALERERWFNRDRGTRHILVNLTDFTARIIKDDRQVTL